MSVFALSLQNWK